jgi:hypothetical protein
MYFFMHQHSKLALFKGYGALFFIFKCTSGAKKSFFSGIKHKKKSVFCPQFRVSGQNSGGRGGKLGGFDALGVAPRGGADGDGEIFRKNRTPRPI